MPEYGCVLCHGLPSVEVNEVRWSLTRGGHRVWCCDAHLVEATKALENVHIPVVALSIERLQNSS